MDARNRVVGDIGAEPAAIEEAPDAAAANAVKIRTRGVNVFYGGKQALFDVGLDIGERMVTLWSSRGAKSSSVLSPIRAKADWM